MSRKQYTFRRWCFTYHLPDDMACNVYEKRLACTGAGPDRIAIIHSEVLQMCSPVLTLDNPKVATYVFQVEETPTTGKLHLQGYISYKDALTRTAVCKIMKAPGIHIEPAQSDAQTNYKYCTKKETRVLGPWALGAFAGPGHRSDYDALYAMAEQFATGREMLQELGGAGMRHLYLYQKTVRVLLHDDENDQRIIAARERRVHAAAALTRPRVPQDDDEEEDQQECSEDEQSEFGSEDADRWLEQTDSKPKSSRSGFF